MSASEFMEWCVMQKLNPIGEERADLRAGIIASVIANIVSSKGFLPSDFMPTFGMTEEEREQKLLRDLDMWALASRAEEATDEDSEVISDDGGTDWEAESEAGG